MKRTRWLCRLIAFLLLAACTSGDRQQRLAQLEELERQNVADSLMTNDSLAQALADFFDRHGTPNERLRAHYILGRTYSDLGDAPRALTSYQDAVKSADTTASDCDYAKLSRVYGWISDIMYKQSLMKDYIENIDRSIQYAWRAGDTLQALTEKAHKVLAYDKMRMPDSAVVWFDEVFNEITHYAGISLASKYSLIPLKILLDRNEMSEKTEAISRLEDDLSSMQRQEAAFAERGRIIKQKSDELADLQSQNEELIRRIKADEGYICQIKEELEKQVKKNLLSEEEVESSLAESGLFPLLKRNRSLTSIEWAKVCMIVNDKLPKFSQLLFSSTELLDEEERKLCILFRLHRSQKEICTLMSMKQSNVSKHASKIMIKLFNKSGGGRMLEKYLENYC